MSSRCCDRTGDEVSRSQWPCFSDCWLESCSSPQAARLRLPSPIAPTSPRLRSSPSNSPNIWRTRRTSRGRRCEAASACAARLSLWKTLAAQSQCLESLRPHPVEALRRVSRLQCKLNAVKWATLCPAAASQIRPVCPRVANDFLTSVSPSQDFMLSLATA